MTPAPAPPPAAAALFGPRLPLAVRYADFLADAGVVRGLIGPREAFRIWDRHILNCAVVAELVPDGARLADIGSGAGLPGIPLALARPDIHVTLVEPMQRRTAFLEEVVTMLDLGARVEVTRARADQLPGGAGSYDVVTARAVAPLDRLVEWSWPLLTSGGVLLALKGSNVAAELEEAPPGTRVDRVGMDLLELPTTVVVVPRSSRRSTRPPRKGR